MQGLSNFDGKMAKELRKLQFLAPGPKALLSDLTPRGTMSAASLAMQRKKLGTELVVVEYRVVQVGPSIHCTTT